MSFRTKYTDAASGNSNNQLLLTHSKWQTRQERQHNMLKQTTRQSQRLQPTTRQHKGISPAITPQGRPLWGHGPLQPHVPQRNGPHGPHLALHLITISCLDSQLDRVHPSRTISGSIIVIILIFDNINLMSWNINGWTENNNILRQRIINHLHQGQPSLFSCETLIQK